MVGVFKRSLTEKVEDIKGNGVPGRGNSQDKGPEVGKSQEGTRNNQEASEVGAD